MIIYFDFHYAPLIKHQLADWLGIDQIVPVIGQQFDVEFTLLLYGLVAYVNTLM